MPTVDTFLPDIIQTTFFSGYTIFNTIVYSLILVIFILAIITMFKKLEIDSISIIFSIIPFILMGSTIRALVDNGIYPKTVFLITPGLYILIGLVTIGALLFSVFLYKRYDIDYRYVLFIIGILLVIPNLVLIPHLNPMAIFYILFICFVLTLLFFALGHFWPLLKDKINLSIISAHLLDATSTFIAVDFFNYDEQHVLANAVYSLSDTALSIFPVKIIVILAVLYIIDEYIEDDVVKNLLKLAVFVLGLAPGFRNFLTLAIGTF